MKQEDEEYVPVVLVAKPNVTSPVWEHFGFQPNDRGEPANLEEAICRICSKMIPVKWGNTSNLRAHFNVYHPDIKFSLSAPRSSGGKPSPQFGAKPSRQNSGAKPSPQDEPTEPAAKYARESDRHRRLTDAVTRYLVEGMVPFRTVETAAFRSMLDRFDRQYELPGKSYFSETAVPDMYNAVKTAVWSELRRVDSFSLTADVWSSGDAASYVSLTAHYLSADWTLESRCLDTAFLPQNHAAAAEDVAEALRGVLDEWHLDERRLSCITAGGGGADVVVAAASALNCPGLTCFGHSLDLAVTSALASATERTSRALGQCHALAAAFSRSSARRRELSKVQAELQLPQRHLVLECATRWVSRQKMVERVLEQIPAISRVLERRQQHLIPSRQDVITLESLNAALKPLAEFADLLAGENPLTMSSVVPVFKLLSGDILKPSDEETTLTSDLKRKICTFLQDEYKPAQELLAKACLLDPRYRGEHVDHLEETKHALMEEMLAVGVKEGDSELKVKVEYQESSVAPPAAKRKKTLGDLLKSRKAATTPLTQRGKAEVEFTRYLQEESIDSNADPLAWWRHNQGRFPLLFELSRKYMCICVTRGPSEHMATSLRSCLKPHEVNMQVFLSRNASVTPP